MFAGLKQRFWLTEGERGVLLAYIGVAVFGAGLAHTVVNNLGGNHEILRTLTTYDIWMILSGALGADIALYVSRDKFGQPSGAGLGQALIGMFTVTFIAAVVAGTFALPGYGTMFGPFAAFVTFWASPLLLIFWGMMLLATHWLYARWRSERDTVFAEPEDDGLPV